MPESSAYILWLSAFYATLSFVIVLPGLPSYIDDDGILYGVIMAAFPAATAITALLIPSLQVRFSTRSLLIWCFAVGAACSVAYGLVRNSYAILVFRAVTGATTSCVVIVRDELNRLCGKSQPKRIKYMAVFTFAMGAGYMLGAVIGSAMQTAFPSVSVSHSFNLDGNTYTGFVLAGVDLVLLILTAVSLSPNDGPAFVPAILTRTTGIEGQALTAETDPHRDSNDMAIYTTQHNMVYISTVLVTISFIGFLTNAVPYIAHTESLADNVVGFISAGVGGAYGIAAMCNPFLIAHMRSSAAVLTLAGTAAALANGLMLGNPHIAQVVVACVLIGLSYSIINSIGMYHLGSLSKTNRIAQTKSFAVVTSWMSIGRVVAPIIVGSLLSANQGQLVYILSLALGAISALFCLYVWWEESRAAKATALHEISTQS